VNVIMGLENVPDGLVKSAVSIGIFDGVHLGHQTLLSVLRSEAERLSGPAVVLTFDRHPSELLSQGNAPLYITPLDRRLELIQQTGVDLVVVAQFDEKLAALTPEEFTDQVLIDRLKAASVVVGTNFRFGRKRMGDIEHLRRLGEERGFRVVGVEPIMVHGAKVSSTRVRHAIERGDVESAAKLLGRPFTLYGKVVTGLGLGRKLGFPTANIDVVPKQIVPGYGVYGVRVQIKENRFSGVCNIGTRPTLDLDERSIEVHIDGFEGNIVGEEISVMFHCRLRDEIKFGSLEELIEQISKDIVTARKCLAAID